MCISKFAFRSLQCVDDDSDGNDEGSETYRLNGAGGRELSPSQFSCGVGDGTLTPPVSTPEAIRCAVDSDDEDDDSEGKEVNALMAVMAQMDAELLNGPSSGSGSHDTSPLARTFSVQAKAVPAAFDADDESAVAYHVMSNLVESHVAQGAHGPLSNLLGQLGINMPVPKSESHLSRESLPPSTGKGGG